MNQAKKYRVSKSGIKVLTGIVIISVIIICSILFGSVLSKAEDNNHKNVFKYYASVEIQKGDTLWGIAEEYRNKETESASDYVKEVKKLNSLTSDTIQDSQYLTIHYYDETFQ